MIKGIKKMVSTARNLWDWEAMFIFFNIETGLCEWYVRDKNSFVGFCGSALIYLTMIDNERITMKELNKILTVKAIEKGII